MLKPETKEQIKLYQFLRLQKNLRRCSFTIPNDGKRSPRMGELMKRAGMRPGASDNFIAKVTKRYAGLFIEMKAKDKNGVYRKPTQLQMEFIEDMLSEGYYACVCNGADDAIAVVQWYLKT